MFRTFLVHVILIPLLLAPAVAEEAWQVTEKAWDAFAAEDWDAVETLANRAARTWGAKAKEINNTLIAFPSAEKAKKFANLNDLATITYLKGEALRKKGDTDGALAAYYTLLADYSFGQCWDNKLWWQPAQLQRTDGETIGQDPNRYSSRHCSIKKFTQTSRKKGHLFHTSPKKQRRFLGKKYPQNTSDTSV